MGMSSLITFPDDGYLKPDRILILNRHDVEQTVPWLSLMVTRNALIGWTLT